MSKLNEKKDAKVENVAEKRGNNISDHPCGLDQKAHSIEGRGCRPRVAAPASECLRDPHSEFNSEPAPHEKHTLKAKTLLDSVFQVRRRARVIVRVKRMFALIQPVEQQSLATATLHPKTRSAQEVGRRRASRNESGPNVLEHKQCPRLEGRKNDCKARIRRG